MAHETRDVAVRPVVVTTLALVVAVVLTFVGMQSLLGHLLAREARESPPPSPLAERYGTKEPPVPRLQTHPALDLQQLRDSEQQVLDTYGWTDREAGVVRIPIARAMELAAERAAGRAR